jgi:hypothetical protein
MSYDAVAHKYEVIARLAAAAAGEDCVYVTSRNRWFIKSPANAVKTTWVPDENFSFWHYIRGCLLRAAEECKRDADTDWLRSAKTANAVELILRSKLAGIEEDIGGVNGGVIIQ